MIRQTGPNKGKNTEIYIGDVAYARYPIKTHRIQAGESMVDVVKKYALPHTEEGDTIVISERVVAISQGRSYLLENIHPGWWARRLYVFVHNNPGGIGLRSPYTMQLAIQEAGLWRILLASVAAVVTKPLGLKGVFYHVAGNNINAIDGPCDYTLPPGNKSAKLGPKNPRGVAMDIAKECGVNTAIIDANDLGVNVLGVSDGVDEKLVHDAFLDNPMGQTDEQTPLTILRKMPSS